MIWNILAVYPTPVSMCTCTLISYLLEGRGREVGLSQRPGAFQTVLASLARKPQGSAVSTAFSELGLQVCTTMPSFRCILGTELMSSCTLPNK